MKRTIDWERDDDADADEEVGLAGVLRVRLEGVVSRGSGGEAADGGVRSERLAVLEGILVGVEVGLFAGEIGAGAAARDVNLAWTVSTSALRWAFVKSSRMARSRCGLALASSISSFLSWFMGLDMAGTKNREQQENKQVFLRFFL